MAGRLYSVAWLGLGAMGKPLAANLKNARQIVKECYVWNRTWHVTQQHASEHGTIACKELPEVGKSGAEVVFTCLPTSSEVFNTMKILVPHLKRGVVVVDCTSGNPRQTREVGAFLSDHGVHMVDAPVSGGPAGAAAGKLSVMVGGDPEVLERVKPAIAVFAKAINHVGPLGSGHAVKSINNILNATQLMMATEGLAALAKQGIDPVRALAAINESSGRSLATQVRIPEHVLTRKFAYNFKVGLMQKDVKIANQILDDYFPNASLLRLAQQMVNEAVDQYGFDADYTMLSRFIEERADVVIKPHPEFHEQSNAHTDAPQQQEQQEKTAAGSKKRAAPSDEPKAAHYTVRPSTKRKSETKEAVGRRNYAMSKGSNANAANNDEERV